MGNGGLLFFLQVARRALHSPRLQGRPLPLLPPPLRPLLRGGCVRPRRWRRVRASPAPPLPSPPCILFLPSPPLPPFRRAPPRGPKRPRWRPPSLFSSLRPLTQLLPQGRPKGPPPFAHAPLRRLAPRPAPPEEAGGEAPPTKSRVALFFPHLPPPCPSERRKEAVVDARCCCYGLASRPPPPSAGGVVGGGVGGPCRSRGSVSRHTPRRASAARRAGRPPRLSGISPAAQVRGGRSITSCCACLHAHRPSSEQGARIHRPLGGGMVLILVTRGLLG